VSKAVSQNHQGASLSAPGCRNSDAQTAPTVRALSDNVERVNDELIWLDVNRAAARALVSTSTILRELRAGRLVGYRVGGRKCWRLRPRDVDDWLTSSHTPAPAKR
jgi:excisionase family DNA binding protein